MTREWTVLSRLEDDSPWLLFRKDSEAFRLRFMGLADFDVLPAQRRITAHIPRETPLDTVTHLLLDQVLPRVAGLDGALVFHAGAVAINRRAVGFMGATGFGKSTLVSSLCQRGNPLITDDCMALRADGDEFRVYPGYPNVRLWEDSAASVASGLPAAGTVAHYTEKLRIDLGASSFPFCDETVPLDRIYVLSDPETNSDKVSVSRLSGREAIMAMVEATFRLDISDQAQNQRDFEAYVRLAERIPFYRLTYPRDYAMLDAVHAVIVDE